MDAIASDVPASSSQNAFVAGSESQIERIGVLRKRVDDLRQQTRKRFQQGASGLQTASFMSQLMDAFVVRVYEEVVAAKGADVVNLLRHQTALLAVGGTGRGDVCPYSDLDRFYPIGWDTLFPIAVDNHKGIIVFAEGCSESV